MISSTRVPDLGPIGLGGAPLGGLFREISDEVAVAAVHACLQAGVRYIDTAPLYGHGTSERRVGLALRGRPRDSFVISSKVGRLVEEGQPSEPAMFAAAPPGTTVRFDFSRDGVHRSVEQSLDRLGLDRLDIAYVHDPDDHVEQALGEAYPALVELRDQGVVGAIGVGMNEPRVPARFVAETDIDAVLIAGRYTLLDTSAADELLLSAADRGVAVVAAGVYNSGVLADPSPDAHFDYRAVPPEVLERARGMRDVCMRHDVPLPAAALAFTRAHPAVTSVLIGMAGSAEVRKNLALLSWPVPDAMWEDLVAEGWIRPDLVPTAWGSPR